MLRPTIALFLALLSAPAFADTLILDANGIQVGPDGKLQRFKALLFDERTGRVKKLYGPGDPLPERVDDAIDVDGRTVLPGLIDAHGHFTGLGLGALQLDVTGTASLGELQQRLRAYAAANPDTKWIVGRGWNQELWPDKSFPTAADLDSVVGDRPVVLQRVDGHAIVVNTAAMRAAGITSATKDPTGGKIEREPSGKPTGLLVDSATTLVDKIVPATTAEERERGMAEAQRILLSNGLTAVTDMGTSVAEWQTMRRLGETGRLAMRVIAYASGVEPLDTIQQPTDWLYGDRLRMGGVKIYADGALGSRGAWLKRPYADKPDTRGLRFLTDAELRQQAGRAATAGFQVAVHAIGDAANAQAISVFEAVGRTHPGDRRWRIEHFQIADPADIPRLAPAGIIASMQPTHQTSDRLMAEKRLGPDRLAGAYAWQTIARSGARLAFGSDFPVESPNPFPGIAAAVSRQDAQGQPPGGWLPNERVSFTQALAGFTRDAAYAGFAEQKFGSLEPGKWADFIIVDRDISTADPQAIYGTQVLETWVAGKKAWERVSSAGGERGR